MSLTEFAERELREAGLFDKDSDYEGMAGEAVLELVKVFAAQGHSGFSAHLVLSVFNRVAAWKPLVPLKNPSLTKEYIEHAPDQWQSTRVSSVFSEDQGKSWYDLDGKIPWWKRILGVQRAYLHFES